MRQILLAQVQRSRPKEGPAPYQLQDTGHSSTFYRAHPSLRRYRRNAYMLPLPLAPPCL